jgi:hypothetical protein
LRPLIQTANVAERAGTARVQRNNILVVIVDAFNDINFANRVFIEVV